MKTAIISVIIILLAIILLIVIGNRSNYEDVDTDPVDQNPVINEQPDQVFEGEISRIGDIAEQMQFSNLSAGDTINPGFVVKGQVPGNWFFEATAPFSVVNWDGLIIGEGYIQAEGEWMTTDMVPFFGAITYELDADTPYTRGAIIFNRHNASGLPEHDESVEVPVQLVKTN